MTELAPGKMLEKHIYAQAEEHEAQQGRFQEERENVMVEQLAGCRHRAA